MIEELLEHGPLPRTERVPDFPQVQPPADLAARIATRIEHDALHAAQSLRACAENGGLNIYETLGDLSCLIWTATAGLALFGIKHPRPLLEATKPTLDPNQGKIDLEQAVRKSFGIFASGLPTSEKTTSAETADTETADAKLADSKDADPEAADAEAGPR